jgi:hypothetical protein
LYLNDKLLQFCAIKTSRFSLDLRGFSARSNFVKSCTPLTRFLGFQTSPSTRFLQFCLAVFFLLDPGQPIWPVTRSLDRVDNRVGFKTMPTSIEHHYHANRQQFHPFGHWKMMYGFLNEKIASDSICMGCSQ